ncbi:MAG: TetR/AcrR family transcriptional regulator [Planctomycetota bacterium]|jgi:AcrR family transcriptional regulator
MSVLKRVLKGYEQRRGELLDVAARLFHERGYGATPVSAIIKAAGVAKGTFYHYFDSKERLLDAIVLRMVDAILAGATAAGAREGLNAVERLNVFFAAAGRWKAEHAPLLIGLLRALYREENVLLRHKITRRGMAIIAPALTEIVRQGAEEGSFNAGEPEDAAEMILHLFAAFRETTAELLLSAAEHPENWPVIERKLGSCERAVERVLGAPEGSVRLAGEGALRAFRGAVESEAGGEKRR